MRHVGMEEEKANSLTKSEIIVMLKEKGIEYDEKARIVDLLELLKE
ncbi:MAG: hypothetical protein RSD97_09660 [Lachnospiraceae bacterium]